MESKKPCPVCDSESKTSSTFMTGYPAQKDGKLILKEQKNYEERCAECGNLLYARMK